MRYRPLTDIFPVGYPFLPTEAEVRRKCRQWLDIAYDEYNLLIITGQINQIVDPYLKEYTTVVMHNLLYREAADPDSDYQLSTSCLEALENDFRRIINHAWTEQRFELEGATDDYLPSPMLVEQVRPTDSSRLDRIEEKVAYVVQELQRMKCNPSATSTVPAKFAYIKSDNLADIREIEATMAIYICANNPSEICRYLFENEGTLFLKMPKHADTIFSCISDRWGDQNHITPKGLRTAWSRHQPAAV